MEVRPSCRVFTWGTRLLVCSKRVWFERRRELRPKRTSTVSLCFQFYFGTLSPTRAQNKSPVQPVTPGLRVELTFVKSLKNGAIKPLPWPRPDGTRATKHHKPSVLNVLRCCHDVLFQLVLSPFKAKRNFINAHKLWRQTEDLTYEHASQLPSHLRYLSMCCQTAFWQKNKKKILA